SSPRFCDIRSLIVRVLVELAAQCSADQKELSPFGDPGQKNLLMFFLSPRSTVGYSRYSSGPVTHAIPDFGGPPPAQTGSGSSSRTRARRPTQQESLFFFHSSNYNRPGEYESDL